MVFSVLNGVPFVYLLSFGIPLRPDKYLMVLKVINDIPTVRLFFTIQSTIDKFTFDVSMVLNGTERYRTVFNDIEWY